MTENIHFSIMSWFESKPVAKPKGSSKDEKKNLALSLKAANDKPSKIIRNAKLAGEVAGLGLTMAGKSGVGAATFLGSVAIGNTILSNKNGEYNRTIKDFRNKYGSDELRTQARRVLHENGNKRKVKVKKSKNKKK